MNAKILVVEDEKMIAEMVRYNLEKNGYRVKISFDGLDALKQVQEYRPDLILLDIMLPELDGLEVCRRIRLDNTVPIIMLTARETEKDIIQGLQTGADDYITKPFSTPELLARVEAQLRRALAFSGSNRVAVMRFGELEIDNDKYEVRIKGEVIQLTIREFELLTFLAARAGSVITREELLREVWGYDSFYGDDRTVDVTISRLRDKIEEDPSNPQHVLTKRGAGYYFNSK